MPRFFVSPQSIKKEPISLGLEESHHALSVLRLKKGDLVQVFDGQGKSYDAKIQEIQDREVYVQITGPSTREALKKKITLAFCVIKPDRMDWLVEKACELGSYELIPILSQRSVIQLSKERWEAKVKKWQKIAQETCKQCGLDKVPLIKNITTFKSILSRFGEFDTILIPHLGESKNLIQEMLKESSKSILLLIGPEGDFADAEVRQAVEAGAKEISLGPLVLRSETAALYALSLCHSKAV